MLTEPLIMLVVDVLGKYVVDAGATLVKEAGQAAAQAASRLCEFVLERLKADPTDARNAERFEENPEGYKIPVADAIVEKAEADPEFASQLSALLEAYKKAASSGAEMMINAASGVVATQGGIAAGAGGVAVEGDVRGGITITNTQTRYSAEGPEP
jgi:hypothetical protein